MSLPLFYFNHTDHSVNAGEQDTGIIPKSSNNKYYGLLWFYGEPSSTPVLPLTFQGWFSVGLLSTSWIIIGLLSTTWTLVSSSPNPTTWTEE